MYSFDKYFLWLIVFPLLIFVFIPSYDLYHFFVITVSITTLGVITWLSLIMLIEDFILTALEPVM